MELTLWTYEGPPHVGAMRIATSMEGVHYVLHAPQGDTYADLLFTMIERRDRRPPVTYTTFQARDLGGDTADLVIRTIQRRRGALPARGPAGGRELHRRADPGPAWRPGGGHGPGRGADGEPGAARLFQEGELGRRRNLLPAGAGPAQGAGAAARGGEARARPLARRGPPAPGEPAGAEPAGLPLPRRRARDHPPSGASTASMWR